MTQVEQVEKQVQEFSQDELTSFRRWFLEFDASAWDRRIEQDAEAGRLDALAEQALKSLNSSNCAPL